MTINTISRETRRLEDAYVQTLKMGARLKPDAELQTHLASFAEYLGSRAARARLSDLQRKFGGRDFEKAASQEPAVKNALAEDKMGGLKELLRSCAEVIRVLPGAVRGLVATALVCAVTEMYKLTHGENPRVREQPGDAADRRPKESAKDVEQQLMSIIRDSRDFDLPISVGSVKEWAEYLQQERSLVSEGKFLKSRGMEPIPDSGFIFVDVPKSGAARVFNFHTETELFAAADDTGIGWRSGGWHPATAIAQALQELGGRERIGLYRSWDEAISDAMKPANTNSRQEILKQIEIIREARKQSYLQQKGGKAKVTQEQKEDILAAIRIIARSDDGAVTIDGHGFGKSHVEVGNMLAKKADLSDVEADVARDLVKYYSRQVRAVDEDLLKRATVGLNLGRLDLRGDLKERLNGKHESCAEADSQNVAVSAKQGSSRREMAETVETVQASSGRRAGVAV